VVVIGAGAVGTATAVNLVRMGLPVVMVDERGPGEGCSFGNAGALSPGSVAPIALPGMVAKVPQWLNDPLGPLRVRWRYLPRAAPWLARWLLASRPAQVDRSAAALGPLIGPVFDEYRRLLGDNVYGALIRREGQLYVWESTAPSRSEAVAHALRERHGVDVTWLTPGELQEMEPALAPIFARGLFLPGNGQTVQPQALVAALADAAMGDGATLLRARVVDLLPREGGGAAVRLEDGRQLDARAVVLAAGAWSNRLAARLGVRIPLETERGYHAMLPEGEGLVRRPVMHGDRSFIASPMTGGLRVAGTVEIAGLDAPADEARAKALAVQARRMFPGLGESEASLWMGCRPSIPDSLPVIGRCPGAPGVVLAFGHGHLGMTGAPMTGRLVAELLTGRPTAIDLTPYRPDRF
jgi:D-amino-acid dehydrogenase